MSALAPLLPGVYVPSATTSGRTAATQPPADSAPSVENFDRIVDDYQRRLYGFALRMTGNREDAEEIVQDAFVRAYRALGKMSAEQRAELRLQPWLYTITLNVTRNRLAQQAALERRARRAGRSRRAPARIERRAAAARNDRRAEYRDRAGRASAACSCRCTCAPRRRCGSSKGAAIRRSPRFSISRSARLNLTSIGPCASCGASSARKSDDLPPKEPPYMRCRDVEALWDELRGECQASLKETVHSHLASLPVLSSDVRSSTKASRTASRACPPRSRRAIWQRRSSSTSPRSRVRSIRRSSSPRVTTPIGRLYVGFKGDRIAYVSIDTGRTARGRRRASRTPAAPPRRARRSAGLARARARAILQHLDRRRRDRRHQRSDSVRTSRASRGGAHSARRGALLRLGRDADRSTESGARGRPRDGAQSAAVALSVPSRRRLVRRSARLLLRAAR